MQRLRLWLCHLLFSFPVLTASGDPATSGQMPPPDSPLVWTNQQGVSIEAQFIRLSGDLVLVVKDGRELRLPLSKLSEESARQARRLAGLAEPLDPATVERPLPMKFEPVCSSRLDTDDRMRASRLGLYRKNLKYARFVMGSPTDELGRDDPGTNNWEPQHIVRLSRDFDLKATEVTWDEWNSVRKLAGEYGYTDLSPGTKGQGKETNGQHPVVGITWWDAIKWCNLLSQIENRTPVYYTHPSFGVKYLLREGTPVPHVDWSADGYRLPTEAEWEFASRPGTSDRAFHTGKIKNTGLEPVDPNLDEAGWFGGNSGGGTHPVATKRPNRFGLHDMHGNVAEWCWDYAGNLNTADVIDPRGSDSGKDRIIRGGSWLDPAAACRAAARLRRDPHAMPNPSVGFRPARNTPVIERH